MMRSPKQSDTTFTMNVMVTVDPPRSGPCSHWATPEDLARDASLDLNRLDPDLVETHLTNATEILYLKSGCQFAGQCTETIRPVARSALYGCAPAWWQSWGYPYLPELISGRWYNISNYGPCVCADNGAVIDLGQYPVTGASVKIDGAAFPTSSYRLDAWHLLARTDGSPWPQVNDLNLADTEEGTWSVTITYGDPPSQLAQTACAQLAAQLTKHGMPDQKCDLPLRVTQVSRQGVSYSLADVMDVIDRGKTGLFLVDLFLETVNPNKLTQPARVLTPDITGPRRLGSI